MHCHTRFDYAGQLPPEMQQMLEMMPGMKEEFSLGSFVEELSDPEVDLSDVIVYVHATPRTAPHPAQTRLNMLLAQTLIHPYCLALLAGQPLRRSYQLLRSIPHGNGP